MTMERTYTQTISLRDIDEDNFLLILDGNEFSIDKFVFFKALAMQLNKGSVSRFSGYASEFLSQMIHEDLYPEWYNSLLSAAASAMDAIKLIKDKP